MPYSSLASSALMIWKALESYGCDTRALFQQAGLDPAKMRDPNARYPDTAFPTLWARAVQASKDPAFGLTVARFWHPASFHALGYSWFASDTLKDALERAARYFLLLTDKEELIVKESGDEIKIVLHNPDPRHPTADEDVDAALGTIVAMCRASYGRHLNPRCVMMQRESPADRGAFLQLFRAPIEFKASENALHFDRQALLTPLPTANAELARANDRVVTDYLARFERGSVRRQVEQKLLEQLSSGHVSQESVARALHMSLRTLQRRLKQEGSSYKQLLDQTRRDLAARYLRESHLTVGEITFLLGFSEAANFTRAFKRWHGLSPSEFRTP
ncbi:MAG: AraC family transcriptional regulator [Acidiferrobacterales bacterium]